MGQEIVLVYKILPYVIYTICAVLSVSSGILIYHGMSSQTERVQTRLRLRHSVRENKERIAKNVEKSANESWFKKAGFPLGLNNLRYLVTLVSVVFMLLGNYVFMPLVLLGEFKLVELGVILLGAFIFYPGNPFSIFVFVMKRVIDYRNAKKNGEVFMLYDLLINELEMMRTTRINAYNLLRDMLPYFQVIKPNVAKVLSVWSSDEGPDKALDMFGEEMDTREARSLVSVMKTLDKVDRETAIESLQGMHSMFARSQIENYRRRRKVTTDLMGIPIKITHFLIILNFIFVVVAMVMGVISGNRAF